LRGSTALLHVPNTLAVALRQSSPANFAAFGSAAAPFVVFTVRIPPWNGTATRVQSAPQSTNEHPPELRENIAIE
jgi:hypothetical protein